MNPRQIELARHALGLDGWGKRTYRNRYLVAPGASLHAEWLRMVENGHAVRHVQPGRSTDMFMLTRAGAEAAIRPGELLDEADWPVPYAVPNAEN